MSVPDYFRRIGRNAISFPVFVSIGVTLGPVLTRLALVAAATACLLLEVRHVLHRRGLGVGSHERAFLLLCPNLTIVAFGCSDVA